VQEYVIVYKISQSADRVRDCCDLSFRLPDVAANCRFAAPRRRSKYPASLLTEWTFGDRPACCPTGSVSFLWRPLQLAGRTKFGFFERGGRCA
jgi:hypothetical protein